MAPQQRPTNTGMPAKRCSGGMFRPAQTGKCQHVHRSQWSQCVTLKATVEESWVSLVPGRAEALNVCNKGSLFQRLSGGKSRHPVMHGNVTAKQPNSTSWHVFVHLLPITCKGLHKNPRYRTLPACIAGQGQIVAFAISWTFEGVHR